MISRSVVLMLLIGTLLPIVVGVGTVVATCTEQNHSLVSSNDDNLSLGSYVGWNTCTNHDSGRMSYEVYSTGTTQYRYTGSECGNSFSVSVYDGAYGCMSATGTPSFYSSLNFAKGTPQSYNFPSSTGPVDVLSHGYDGDGPYGPNNNATADASLPP